MKIIRLLKDKYVLSYLFIYAFVLLILNFWSNIQLNELLVTAFLIGVGFTTLSLLLTKFSKPLFEQRAIQKYEPMVIVLLCMFFMICITLYPAWLPLNSNVFKNFPWLKEFSINSFKFFFIVLIPIFIYALIYGFSLKDWGITLPVKSYITGRSIFIFCVFFLFLMLFQYYFGRGAKDIREGLYSFNQLIIAIPLYFIWLLVFVGIVEEFFFRVFLQSRIAIILNSQTGGVIISSAIFGLAHAPGIYLRGGGILANLGSQPSFLLSMGYSFLLLSVAGFFLSVIWVKTRNFWLIAFIHSTVDLLPGLSKFISSMNFG